MTPAGKLALLFGNVDGMAALYAPGIEWSLPASLPFARPTVGFEEITAFHRRVWGELYRPDCEVKILDEVGDEAVSAVRFAYRAFSLEKLRWYENEYTLFARSGPQGIFQVHEAFDTVTTHNFFRDQPITFRAFDD